MNEEQINEKAQEVVDILISQELSHDQMLDVLAMATIKIENIEHNNWIANRITDKFLDEHFKQHHIGYWRINEETIISCEGQVYAEDSDNSLVWYAEVNNLDELKNLLLVLKVELLSTSLNSDEELNNILP